MKNYFLLFLLLVSFPAIAQLQFCEGSKGDPIFQEDFENTEELDDETTSYNFVNGVDPEDGQYTISDQIGQQITTWHSSFPPQTDSNGNAFVVNADYSAGQFFRTEISGLCENTSYEFSAYLMNILAPNNGCPGDGIPINVKFEIWDESDTELLAEGDTGNIFSSSPATWEQYALTFQSEPGQDTVILKMFNNGDGGCGNDLAIDDIIFRSCGDLTEVTTTDTEESSFTICEPDAPQALELMATPDFSAYDEHYFQWQESADNENWTDIPGETNEFYETPQLNETRFYRVKVAEDEVNLDNNLCSTVSESFEVSFVENPSQPESNGDLVACGNESFPALSVNVQDDESVNWYAEESGGEPIAENTTTYTPETPGTFYAEAVKSGFECGGSTRTPVSLEVSETPEVEDEELQLCEGGELQLEAGVEAAEYSWNTGESQPNITINSPGTYSVLVTNEAGCSSEKTIEVSEVDLAVIGDIISEDNLVIIEPENEGDFEYSLDGENYQSNNEFEVSGGIYTAYMRDRSGCNTVLEEFPHIVMPKFITPNGDGYNDTFQIKGLSYFETSVISIYDRYGKLLATGNGENFTWDGTYNNRQLPADDYWYEVKIKGFEPIKGHFTLKR